MPSSNLTTPRDAIEALRELTASRKVTQFIDEQPMLERLLAQPESTAVTPSDPSIPGPLTIAMRRLRVSRDRLLNETLANNPLQRAASIVLEPLAEKLADPLRSGKFGSSVDVSALDILENVGAGAAVGSVLIPDDAAVDPTNPIPALQLAGIGLGAIAEGFTADIGILKGLKIVKVKSAAAGSKNLAKSADVALKLFGQGEDLSKMRQVAGGAALGGLSELGLQTAALKDPNEILAMSGLVALGGGAVGGAIAAVAVAGRKTISGARALRSFSEELGERGGTFGEQIAPKVEQELVSGPTKASEAGLQRGSEFEQRIDNIVDDISSATKVDKVTQLAVPTRTRTSSVAFEALFDAEAPETFVSMTQQGLARLKDGFEESFIYEAKLQRFPSFDNIEGITLADDFRFFEHGVTRSSSLAEADIELVLAPIRSLKGKEAEAAFQLFERIVVGRDLLETAAKGHKLPLDVSAAQLAEEISTLELVAPRQVLEMLQSHKQLVGGWRNDLIRRGKLPQGDGYENYFPHQMVDDLAADDAFISGADPLKILNKSPTSSAFKRGSLKQPNRPYTRQRKGSARTVKTDYIEVMFRAARMFHTDNLVDDFISNVGKASSTLRRKDLLPAELASFKRSGRFVHDGTVYRAFHPKGNAYFRASMVQEEALEALAVKLEDEIPINLEDLPEIREVLAVGRRKELLVPAVLADRLEQFYRPDPLSRRTILSPLARANAWWKRNTIWWGLQRFFVFQVLGDSTNLLRSNPAAFLQIRNNRLDSPVLRAINEIAKKYGMPLGSKEQLITSLAGGAGGLTLDQFAQDDADPSTLVTAASILAAAGLGYVVASRRMANLALGASSIYDEADKLAVINSGFAASEEALSRRILGGNAGITRAANRNPWQRSLDTIFTMLSGKVQGDPAAFARVPAEVVGRMQVERENVLRLASYMQLIESGVDNKVAARRASRSLVDYGQFTEFENKILRGFGLPFYAFYRHNIPNWVKAAAGKDVGGKTKVAAAAVAAIGAADIAVQAWNETFFPDVEKGLPPFIKRQFHIIVGNPVTGESYSDVNGTAMVVGWEMPYEQALEFFGLARPGYVYSQLFGTAGELENNDLTKRLARMGEDVGKLRGAKNQFLELLSPAIKLPAEYIANRNFFTDIPLVPARFIDTDEGKSKLLNHFANTLFRQVREAKRLQRDVTGRRFDPLSSAFGLGLPVSRVVPSRQWQGHVHEIMDEIELETKRFQAPYKKAIDNLLRSRDDFGQPNEGETQQVLDIISSFGLLPNEAERAYRYYNDRGYSSALMRRYESLTLQERGELWARLSPEANTYLTGHLNGGSVFDNLVNEGIGIEAAAPALLGGN